MTREYPDRPIAGVGAIILKGDQVLLIRRGKPPITHGWSLPGGKQELGETVEAALGREILEETGLEIRIGGFVELVDFIERDADNRIRFHYTLADYWAEPIDGEPKAGSDVVEAKYVPLENLGNYDLWSKTVEVIEKAVALRIAHNNRDRHSIKGHLKTFALAATFSLIAYALVRGMVWVGRALQ